jgi:tetratricopeptide (TPR) repeat protein/capsular polysaccharide biosynthesis protein
LALNLYELYYNLGHVLHQQGDLLAAADSYRQAIALNVDFADAHQGLGVVLDQQERCWLAVKSYQRVIALQPDNIAAYSNLGCALLRAGQPELAIQSYSQGLSIDRTWATLHYNLGQALFAQKQVGEAIAAYHHAIELQPDFVGAHYHLGKALQAQGQHLSAAACFERVTQLAPDQVAAYGDCAVSWLTQRNWKAAIDCLHAAITQQTVFVEFYFEGVARLSGQDSLTEAKIACTQLLYALQHPVDVGKVLLCLQQTYASLGNVLTQYGGYKQYQQAEIYYRKALELQPQNSELYWRLGNCLTQQQRQEEAIAVYHWGLAITPASFQISVQLGCALERQGKLEQAIACYHRALQLTEQENLDGIDSGLLLGLIAQKTVGEKAIETEPPRSWYRLTRDWIVAANIDRCYYISLQPQQGDGRADDSSVTVIQPAQPACSTPPVCEGLNCPTCLKQISSWFQPVHLGQGIYVCCPQQGMEPEPLPLFVATIPSGRTWVVPQTNAWMVCNAIATLTPNGCLLADLSRDYPGQLPGCQAHTPTQHRIFELETLPALEQVNGRVAVLTGLSGHVYFHWMVDVLPRLEMLNQAGVDLESIDWFLLNSDRQPFQQATLDALGIPANKVLLSDRHPHIQAQQLIVPSFPGHLGWLQPWALQFLRRVFLPKAKSNEFPERIYISRSRASYRRVLNEPEVIAQLNQVGFVSVVLEDFSFPEQVALFANARAIVAPHGSGLTNLVFCKPGTQVIELVSPHYVRPYYWVISSQLQLQHYYLVGEGFACDFLRELMYQNPLTEDMLVNLAALKKMIRINNWIR